MLIEVKQANIIPFPTSSDNLLHVIREILTKNIYSVAWYGPIQLKKELTICTVLTKTQCRINVELSCDGHVDNQRSLLLKESTR